MQKLWTASRLYWALLLLGCALFSWSALAQNPPQRIYSLSPELGFRTVENDFTSSKLYRFKLHSELSYRLSPRIQLSAEAEFTSIEGQVYSLLPYEDKPENKVEVYEALVNYRFLANDFLSFGIIKQGDYQPPLLVDEKSGFFGLAHKLNYRAFGVKGEAAIAGDGAAISSAKTSNAKSTIIVGEQLHWALNEATQPLVSLGYFSFIHPSSVQAYRSSFRGNSVRGTKIDNSSFETDFQGAWVGLSPHFQWSQNKIALSFLGAQNLKVRAQQGRAFEGGAAYENCASAACVNLRAAYFYVEPEVSISAFASEDRYYTNLKGSRFDLGCALPKEGLVFSFQWLRGSPIKNRSYSSDTQIFSLSVKGTYEVFN